MEKRGEKRRGEERKEERRKGEVLHIYVASSRGAYRPSELKAHVECFLEEHFDGLESLDFDIPDCVLKLRQLQLLLDPPAMTSAPTRRAEGEGDTEECPDQDDPLHAVSLEEAVRNIQGRLREATVYGHSSCTHGP